MNKRLILCLSSITLVIILLSGLSLVVSTGAQAAGPILDINAANAVFAVNATNDVTDGSCNVSHCSLREAILAANSASGADTITFDLSPNATVVLSGTQLPVITDPLSIDGSTAVDLTISGNSASRVLEIGVTTPVTLTSLTITDGYLTNSGSCPANCGGGISNSGQLSLFNSTIFSNVAYYGGGVYNTGSLTVSFSTISDNRVYLGGALFNQGSATINHSTLNDNTASNGLGGGAYNDGTLNLINSTMSANWAFIGGAIFNDGALNINNSTLNLNGATNGTGGGIRNNSLSSSLNFSNSIIANVSDSSSDCAADPATIGLNFHNFIEDNTCSPAYTGDPMLGPLADNGGETWTHGLLTGSGAIDSGDNGSCEDDDQRGVARPQGSSCDIGAFELKTYDCNQSPLLAADTAELNAAIACYNAKIGGSHTISLTTNITLTGPTVTISNTSGADLLLAGDGHTVDGANSYRAFTVESSIATFEAITITHGADSSTECDGASCGGGLLVRGGASVTLNSSVVVSNTADNGGGIYNDGGTMGFYAGLIIENDAQVDGGGIFNAGTMTITRSFITDNTATTYQYAGGGGLLNDRDSILHIDRSSITGNKASYYGAGLASDGGAMTIGRSTFSGNSTVYGGGLSTWGPTKITDSTFTGNSATYGGGIYNEDGTTYLTNSTVSDNSAEYGGGIMNDYLIVNVSNSTITNNRAGTAGGGIASYSNGGTFTTITNTIVSGNLVSGTIDADDLALRGGLTDTFISSGYNLIGAFPITITAFQASGDITNTLPALGALADNGGPTLTHAPLANSPAIDHIPDGVNGCGTTMTTDQRGVIRPQGSSCDIGAVEMPVAEWFIYLPIIIK